MYKATAVVKSPAWQAAFEARTFSTKTAREAAPRDADPVGSTCKGIVCLLQKNKVSFLVNLSEVFQFIVVKRRKVEAQKY